MATLIFSALAMFAALGGCINAGRAAFLDESYVETRMRLWRMATLFTSAAVVLDNVALLLHP